MNRTYVAQIRTRIFEKWGTHDTLQNCLSKSIRTFKEIKAIVAAKAPGTYLRNTMTLNDPKIMHLLCTSVIGRSGKEYMTWEESIQHPALFQFSVLDLTQADMASCEHLSKIRQ